MIHSAKSLEILIAHFNWGWKWISKHQNFLWEWNWVFADGSVKHLLRCSPPSLPGVQQPGGTNVAPWLGLWGVKGYSKAAWSCLASPLWFLFLPSLQVQFPRWNSNHEFRYLPCCHPHSLPGKAIPCAGPVIEFKFLGVSSCLGRANKSPKTCGI